MKIVRFIVNTALVLVGLLVVLVAGLVVFATQGSDPEMTQADKDRGTARLLCREAIAQALHDPDSAEMGRYYSWPAGLMDGDDSIMLVQPEIRATNGFGAKVPTRFECRFSVAPEGGVIFLGVREV